MSFINDLVWNYLCRIFLDCDQSFIGRKVDDNKLDFLFSAKDFLFYEVVIKEDDAFVRLVFDSGNNDLLHRKGYVLRFKEFEFSGARLRKIGTKYFFEKKLNSTSFEQDIPFFIEQTFNSIKKLFKIKTLGPSGMFGNIHNQAQYRLLDKRISETLDLLNGIKFRQDLYLNYFVEPGDAHKATGIIYQRQIECLEMVRAFADICKKYDITYWLDFGTLLGSVRHKGFIPWDTDCDFGMTIDSAQNLQQIIATEYSEKYTVFEKAKAAQWKMVNNATKAAIDFWTYTEVDDENIRIVAKMRAKYAIKPVRKDLIYPLAETTFEGITMSCPGRTSEYLKYRYGDYLKLPVAPHIYDHGIEEE